MFYLKFLCDAKLITPLFFNISSKYLKWKQLFNTDTSWNYLLSDMSVGAVYQGEEVAEEGGEALMSNLCLAVVIWILSF